MNVKINVIRNVNTEDTNAVVTAPLICLTIGPGPVKKKKSHAIITIISDCGVIIMIKFLWVGGGIAHVVST